MNGSCAFKELFYVSSRYLIDARCRNIGAAVGQTTRAECPFLKKYTIPEPVAGGLLVALALLVLKKAWVGKSTLI